MSEGKVEIVFTANASQVVTATGQINASLARTATAGDAAGKAINSGMTGASASTSKALKALGPLGGVLSKISPEAGSAASSVAGLTGAVEGFGASGVFASVALGPLLAILAPLAIAAGFVAGAMADSARRAKLATEAMEGLEVAMRAVEEIAATTTAGQKAFSVTLGLVTKEEDAYNTASEKLVKTYKFKNEQLKKAIDLRVEAGQEQGLLEDVSALRKQQDALFAVTKAEMKRLDTEHEYAVAVAESDEIIKARDEAAAKGAAAAAKAAAKTAAASERAFKAIQDELDVMEARTVAAKKYAELLAGRLADSTKLHEAIQAQTLDEIATVNAKGDAAQEAISKQIYANKTLINDGATNADALADINAKLEADRILVAATTEAEITAIKDEESKKRDALRDADLQAERDAADASFQTALEVSDAVMGLADQQLQALQDSYDTSTEAGKAGALEVWKLQQALALARAVLDVASAVSAASTLPPPASFAAMGVAAVMGAINVAAVASAPAPEFAAGGFPEASTTGTLATLHPREAVLSQQGRLAMGDDTIREANAGRSSKNSTTLITVYKHKSFDYFVADNLLTNGPLARTLRQGDRVGQIRRGRA